MYVEDPSLQVLLSQQCLENGKKWYHILRREKDREEFDAVHGCATSNAQTSKQACSNRYFSVC